MAELLAACRADDPDLVAESRTLLVREPLEIVRDAPIVGIVSNTAAEVLGSAPPVVGASYWADSAFMRLQASRPCCSVQGAREPMPWRSG